MDVTFTLPLLPNPPINNPSREILMAESLPSYKDIIVGKIITWTNCLETMAIIKDKAPEIVGNQILLSEEDRQRYMRHGVTQFIIKPVKSKLNHQYLKKN